MSLARSVAAVGCSAFLAGAALAGPATTATAAVTPCSNGLVALTFDDGPNSILTSKFLRTLRDRRVPATFFMLGKSVDVRPGLARRASRLGFTVGNHSYHHELLTSLGNAGIRQTLKRTRRAIRNAGAKASPLMRPPYGAISPRVRDVVDDLGLVPVLWTVDPRDWDGRTTAAIVSSTLRQLRPHAENLVLLHDGVRNSARTLNALPRIIRGARSRGFCFAGLDAGGVPTPPVPEADVADATVTEVPGGSSVTLRVTLDRPTSRTTSVRLHTVAGSATEGRDYVGYDERVTFSVGERSRMVRVRVRHDLRDEAVETFVVRLSRPRGLAVVDPPGVVVVRDDDPPPQVSLGDAEVTEPATGQVDVPVTLRLSRVSERWVRLTVVTVPATADETDYVPGEQPVAFPPGVVAAKIAVVVLADEEGEEAETFGVEAVDGSNVDLAGAAGTVTILPPLG